MEGRRPVLIARAVRAPSVNVRRAFMLVRTESGDSRRTVRENIAGASLMKVAMRILDHGRSGVPGTPPPRAEMGRRTVSEIIR